MEKMKMQSANITDMNIDKIAALFPNCITETADENGKLKKAINFEMLRAELSEDIVEGDEAYEFTWVGKKAAIAEANRHIRKTLRPCPEESVNWDSTENLYIEGDNLEVLKLLQESYLGKVKMIYIDPPYNTGNDFIYRDDFAVSSDDYAEESGQLDEDGNRLFKNTDSNGRFHSDWCSMIYSRLMLARNLLSDDGVIFISIDDREVNSVQWIVKEIFGECNFVAQFVWKSKLGKVGTTSTVATTHEYILCFAKNIEKVKFEMIENHSDGRKENLRQWGVADRREDRPSMFYPISINGKTVLPIKEDGTEGRWRVGEEMAKDLLAAGVLELVEKDGKLNIYRNFPEGSSFTPYDTLLLDEIGTTAKGAIALKNLDMAKIFDFSKPVELIKHFIKLSTNNYPLSTENCPLILDFFSGSATTAHAVMQLNAEDGGHRKFIMVQLPEATDEKSEAYKAGYKNICEIGKERIRRAGAKIKSEVLGVEGEDNSTLNSPNSTLDTGFRVLKLDETNMQDVYYTPAETTQTMLAGFESNIKPDRTDLDLLFGCLLDWGLPLSMPYRSEQIEGVTVHTVGGGDLIACFDKAIPESVIKTIAKRQPLRVVFRDDSFADSPSKINVSEIFKMISPDTRVKVI